MSETDETTDAAKASIRQADLDDAPVLWGLVHADGVLDENSPYAYCLLASHFRDTCLVAEVGDRVVGFVAAIVPPRQPDSRFVWQIGVAPEGRGQGLASRLLDALVSGPLATGRPAYVEATVTPSNAASRALFRSLARRHGVPCEVAPWLGREHFPEGAHEPEDRFRIGPFAPS